MQHRKLSFDALYNARDLGGYRVGPEAHTRWKSIVRTDGLFRLTPAGARAILDYGVRTVIDLRFPEEAAREPSPFQADPGLLNYRLVSMLGESERAWLARRPPTEKPRWNCMAMDLCQPEIAQSLREVAHAPEGGVLFHCHAGKDRTGLLAILLLALVGAPADDIARDYAISTDWLQGAYSPSSAEDLRCPPEHAHNTLAYLAERGGSAGYMRAIGLSGGEINALRARLV